MQKSASSLHLLAECSITLSGTVNSTQTFSTFHILISTEVVGHPEASPYQPYDFDAANKHYVENVFNKSFSDHAMASSLVVTQDATPNTPTE
jgi:hypothetical protein